MCICGFFCNDPATTGIYTLSLHDALPISVVNSAGCGFIKITGGGHVPTGSKDHSHSFGFYIQLGDGGWMVNFEYNDNHKGKPKDKKNALAPLQYHANALATFAEGFIDP